MFPPIDRKEAIATILDPMNHEDEGPIRLKRQGDPAGTPPERPLLGP